VNRRTPDASLFPLDGNSAKFHDPDNNPRLVEVYKQLRQRLMLSAGFTAPRCRFAMTTFS